MSIKNITILLLVVAILLAGCTSKPQAPQQQKIQIIQQQERSISAYGYGKVKVKPDLVRFIITVQTQKSGLSPAQEENEKATQDLLSILLKYEIASNDVKQDYLQQEKSGSDSKPYFKIQRNIKVVLRDLTQLEPLFKEIIQIPAYQISGIRFQVSNVVLYEQQALILAISDARAKAETMSTELGCEVGEVLTMSMDFTPAFQGEDRFMTGRYEDNTLRMNDLPDLVTQSGQEISIQYGVRMEFEVK